MANGSARGEFPVVVVSLSISCFFVFWLVCGLIKVPRGSSCSALLLIGLCLQHYSKREGRRPLRNEKKIVKCIYLYICTVAVVPFVGRKNVAYDWEMSFQHMSVRVCAWVCVVCALYVCCAGGLGFPSALSEATGPPLRAKRRASLAVAAAAASSRVRCSWCRG
eukprot:TRINITY_DN23700_c0_g1_i2.p1 TRINITY_DN23700_c0_g1~~TRINITY_DN23700_c0_g1_i2.p1  ORF type:complete len:189 (+),score=4.60 TRINITY_DN23700_c0_g1_i2:77-568(+)